MSKNLGDFGFHCNRSIAIPMDERRRLFVPYSCQYKSNNRPKGVHSEDFSGIKTRELGTEKKPPAVLVQTEEILKKMTAIFKEHEWAFQLIWRRVSYRILRIWKFY